jgi:hypothetical protein
VALDDEELEPYRVSKAKDFQIHVYAGVSRHGGVGVFEATCGENKVRNYETAMPFTYATGKKKGLACAGVGAAEYQQLLRFKLMPNGDRLFGEHGKGGRWVLQQDGAKPHSARSTQKLFKELGMEHRCAGRPRPARRPNLPTPGPTGI